MALWENWVILGLRCLVNFPLSRIIIIEIPHGRLGSFGYSYSVYRCSTSHCSPRPSLPLSLGLELLVIFLLQNPLLLGGRYQDASATLGRHAAPQRPAPGPIRVGWLSLFMSWDAVSVVKVWILEMLCLVFFLMLRLFSISAAWRIQDDYPAGHRMCLRLWFLATFFDWKALVTCNSNLEQTVRMCLLSLVSFVGALLPSSICIWTMCLSLSMPDTNVDPRPAQDQRMTRCKTCTLQPTYSRIPKVCSYFMGSRCLMLPKAENKHTMASSTGGANKFQTCKNQSVKQVHATERSAW